jgi:hypothetical protein
MGSRLAFVPILLFMVFFTAGLARAESFKGLFSPATAQPRVDVGQSCSQKNQGSLLTCHAFALSCPIEAFESRSTPGFSVSENWLVFVSTLDRLCSTSREVAISEGHVPEWNLDRLRGLGYCASNSFLSYGSGGGPVPTALKVFNSLSTWIPGKATMAPGIAREFRQAFGISWQGAQTALCAGSDRDKQTKVASLKDVSPHFLGCFKESMQNKNKLKACSPAFSGDGLTSAQKIAALKQSLARGEPVIVTVRNYSALGGGKHEFHAVSVTGYDETKRSFLVRNSWGAGKNFPIPYGKMDDLLGFGSLNCADSTARQPGPPGLASKESH